MPIGDRSPFHLAMALAIAASMVAGFYYELPKYVTHPAVRFPAILGVHAAVFSSWMVLYVVQTLFVRVRSVDLHRMLGWLGLALALIMPPLGVATAIVMRRFDLLAFHSQNMARDMAFLAAPLADIAAFTVFAWLGIARRARSDQHGRLMFLSMAAIADAGFSRLPLPGVTTWFFAGNLLLCGAAIVHDKLTTGSVHQVYRWGLPFLALDEGLAIYLWLAQPAWWVSLCRSLLGA
jgi:hypothetical protein